MTVIQERIKMDNVKREDTNNTNINCINKTPEVELRPARAEPHIKSTACVSTRDYEISCVKPTNIS